MEKNNCNYRITALDFEDRDGKIYFSSVLENAICEGNLKTKKARILAQFPQYSLTDKSLYYWVGECVGKIVFVPLLADEIAVYDKTANSVTYVDYKEKIARVENSQVGSSFFAGIFSDDSNVYLYGGACAEIIKLNVSTLQIELIPVGIKNVSDYYATGYVKKQYKVYLGLKKEAALLELDVQTAKVKKIELGVEVDRVEGICGDSENVYVLASKKNIYYLICWNQERNRVNEILIDQVNNQNLFYTFHAPICIGQKVMILPWGEVFGETSQGHAYIVDVKEQTVSIYRELDEVVCNDIGSKRDAIAASRIVDNTLLFMTCNTGKWYEFDIQTNRHSEFHWEFEDDEEFIVTLLNQKIEEGIHKGQSITEGEFALSDYVTSIPYCKSEQDSMEQSCGKVIYDFVKNRSV